MKTPSRARRIQRRVRPTPTRLPSLVSRVFPSTTRLDLHMVVEIVMVGMVRITVKIVIKIMS